MLCTGLFKIRRGNNNIFKCKGVYAVDKLSILQAKCWQTECQRIPLGTVTRLDVFCLTCQWRKKYTDQPWLLIYTAFKMTSHLQLYMKLNNPKQSLCGRGRCGPSNLKIRDILSYDLGTMYANFQQFPIKWSFGINLQKAFPLLLQ